MRKVNNSIAVGKRKEAVARAYIKPAKESGKGIIRINGVPATIIEPVLARMIIQELFFVMEEPNLFDYNIEVFTKAEVSWDKLMRRELQLQESLSNFSRTKPLYEIKTIRPIFAFWRFKKSRTEKYGKKSQKEIPEIFQITVTVIPSIFIFL